MLLSLGYLVIRMLLRLLVPDGPGEAAKDLRKWGVDRPDPGRPTDRALRVGNRPNDLFRLSRRA
jgi:hypothetical protein